MLKLILTFVLLLHLNPTYGQRGLDRGLYIEWRSLPEASGYILEISQGDQFNKILISENTRMNKFFFSFQEPGDYHWRVKGYKKAPTETAEWLENGVIKIPSIEFTKGPEDSKRTQASAPAPAAEKKSKLAAPEMISPLNRIVAPSLELSKVKFSWKKQAPQALTSFKITADKKTEKMIMTEKDFVILSLKPNKSYHWNLSHFKRIKNRQYERLSPDTKWRKFDLRSSSHELSFSLGSLSQSIKGEDTLTKAKGDLESRSAIEATVYWKKRWSPKFESRLIFVEDKISFIKPENRELTNPDQTLMKFGLGLQWNVGRYLSIYDELYYGQELFYATEGVTAVKLEKVFALSNRLGASLHLLNTPSYEFSIMGGLSNVGSANLDEGKSKAGTGYHSGVVLMKKWISGHGIKLGADYQSISKDTVELKQLHQEIRAYAAIVFRIPD